MASTNDPRWGQMFGFSGLRRADLNHRFLEVSVWDYVRYGANDFLGEVTLDLGNHPLDDEPEWYILQPHLDTSFHSVSVFRNWAIVSVLGAMENTLIHNITTNGQSTYLLTTLSNKCHWYIQGNRILDIQINFRASKKLNLKLFLQKFDLS